MTEVATLSPMRQMELLAHMARLVGDESQFVVSTHSPILMTYPGADVLQITEEGSRGSITATRSTTW